MTYFLTEPQPDYDFNQSDIYAYGGLFEELDDDDIDTFEGHVKQYYLNEAELEDQMHTGDQVENHQTQTEDQVEDQFFIEKRNLN